MRWLSANWLWIVLIGAMLWMHLRHGGMHGSHHGHDRQVQGNGDSHDHTTVTSTGAGDGTSTGHRHGDC